MSAQRPAAKVTQPTRLGKDTQPDLTAPQVLRHALATLEEHVPLQRPCAADCSCAEIFSVLLYAAAHGTPIEQGCAALEQAPHPNTVRDILAGVQVAELEDQLNQALAQGLPKGLSKRPLEVAVDLKLVPYYGQAHEGEEEFLVHGQPKQGTTTFFGYASLYTIKRDRRSTLAVVAVRCGEGLVSVLRRLWSYWSRLGLSLHCLYLDREFYSVAVCAGCWGRSCRL